MKCSKFFYPLIIFCISYFLELPIEGNANFFSSIMAQKVYLMLHKIASTGGYGNVILLPKHLEFNDTAALTYVLEHELVHIRRFDALSKAVLQMKKAFSMEANQKLDLVFIRKLYQAIIDALPVVGDVNDDGKVNIRDATALQKQIAGVDDV